ncbi:unannotated protein [freshwater metagenome]|uniref:Unannotated protein n=1 Tax=freshwater metagenome TaxID=449393 RepID=A0A6J6EEA1_9ZZZZ|nr:DUF563 domain-containing protein [Actinomycetota bacterium]
MNKLKAKFTQKRNFRKILNHDLKKNIEILESRIFKHSKLQNGKVIVCEDNLKLLQSCVKSGSWKKSRISKIFSPRTHVWKSKKTPYFPDLSNLVKNIGFNTELITSVNLLEINNAEIFMKKTNNLSLNMYNGSIRSSTKPAELKSAFYLDLKGSESFQHFISETLPVITLARESLIENPQIPIIIKQPIAGFKAQKHLIERLGIVNSIVFSDSYEILTVEKLQLLDFKPFNALYAMPQEPYKLAHQLIESSYKSNNENTQDKIVFFVRDEKLRNIINLQFVMDKLDSFAKSLNLKTVYLNPSLYTTSEVESILRSAKIVFGVHGGANYNMLFAPASAVFVEFLPIYATDSVQHLVLSFGQTYFPFAIPFSKGDKAILLTATDLELIFEKLTNQVSFLGDST